ncbi:thioredoxin family protein [Pyxidicoccus trucidator]|uniref:thioredoxin family protein n=1 Tax=Pyxidicoccus trucidator TaxID=2709662 RepID=UPI0013DBCC39|nr:thioredoxin family protein [Pyxidicoccus trucidator]
MPLRHAAWLLLAIWGCTTGSTATKRPTHEEAGLAFIEDDYGAALRLARARHLPLFVEAWAPWCQSCRSMRATVLTDPALHPRADRFVWLAIDTDKPGNEAFLRRFPVDTWPTVLVLDADRETVLARSLGAVSVPQLLGFLDGAERAFQQDRRERPVGLARADALAHAGSHGEAITSYQEALARMSREDPLRAGTVVSLLKSLNASGASAECMRLTARELSSLPRVDDRARLLYIGIGCALDLETEEAVALRTTMEEEAIRGIQSPAEALLPALRSSLYEATLEVRQAADDEAGTRRVAEEWLAFLEADARNARSAEERSALDNHRLRVALLLEEPGRAIPALEQSERELPADYNPPARLALLYLMSGQLDRALGASDRALAIAWGFGRSMVVATHARILLARGERAKAEQLLKDTLHELERAPEGLNTPRQQRVLRATLDLVQAKGN